MGPTEKLEALNRLGVDSPTLLVVDDDSYVCRAIDRVMRHHGVTVYTASSAARGMKLLELHDVHVVLSDFNMPSGDDGITFLSTVRERYPALQRVLLTGGFLDPEDTERAFNDAGVQRFLTKPWAPSTLIETVEDCLEAWLRDVERERRFNVAHHERTQLQFDKANLEEQVHVHAALLERANMAWRRTFDAIANPLTLVDTDHAIQRANLAAARASGEEIRLLNGRKCHEVLFGHPSPCGACPVAKLGSDKETAEAELIDERRGRVWHVTTWPAGDGPSDNVPGALHVCHYQDITEKIELQKQMIMLEKMAAIGELAGCVAHELNNPLTGILSFSQFLNRKLSETPAAQSLASDIEEAARRCVSIVESLLDFARPSANPTEVVELDPADLLHNCVNVSRTYLSKRKGLQIRTDIPDDLFVIKGNSDEFKSLFLNLINNAAQAMDGVGMVTIEAENLGEERAIRVRVTDTGPGVPEAIRDKIFAPFFTTKAQNKGGTGLGLAIVKRAVDAHGGRIEVTCRAEGGARFTVTLPATPPRQDS